MHTLKGLPRDHWSYGLAPGYGTPLGCGHSQRQRNYTLPDSSTCSTGRVYYFVEPPNKCIYAYYAVLGMSLHPEHIIALVCVCVVTGRARSDWSRQDFISSAAKWTQPLTIELKLKLKNTWKIQYKAVIRTAMMQPLVKINIKSRNY